MPRSRLRSLFRSITRALKPVLAEIALKTVENLEENPNLHEQVVEYQGDEEYDGIQKMLDDALARRKAQLDAQLRFNKANLQKTLHGEQQVRRSRCELQTKDLRDLQLDRLEHDLLTVARQDFGGAGPTRRPPGGKDAIRASPGPSRRAQGRSTAATARARSRPGTPQRR